MKMNVNWKDNKCMANDAMVAWIGVSPSARTSWHAKCYDKDGDEKYLGGPYDTIEEAQQAAEVFLGIH